MNLQLDQHVSNLAFKVFSDGTFKISCGKEFHESIMLKLKNCITLHYDSVSFVYFFIFFVTSFLHNETKLYKKVTLNVELNVTTMSLILRFDQIRSLNISKTHSIMFDTI